MPTEKLKVLHVIARLNIGGTATYLDYLIQQLEGRTETLLAVGHVQGSEVEDSRLEKLQFKRIKHLGRKISPVNDVLAYFELRRLIKEFNPDIIHSHTFKAGLLCRLMFFRITKVHTFHGHLLTDPEFSGFKIYLIVKVEQVLSRFTKKLVTVGEQVAIDLVQSGVGKKEQYISIAPERKRLSFVTREEARASLKIGSSTPVVLWMARMAPVKNPELALEVAQLLPQVDFLLAGGGELFEQIKSQAPSNVYLLGWVNPALVLPAADVFMSTSLNEGVPYSIIEALSQGIPVVALKSGAIAEIVKDNLNGFLTSRSASEIARYINNLVISPTLKQALSQSAIEEMDKSMNEHVMGKEHESIYRELLIKNLIK